MPELHLTDDAEHLDGAPRGLDMTEAQLLAAWTPRREQIAEALQTRPKQAAEQAPLLTAKAELEAMWEEFRSLRDDKIGPLIVRNITLVIRQHVPEATAVLIEASDQGGDGWIYAGLVTREGKLSPDDGAHDYLHDDDDLNMLLDDYGLVEASGDGITELRLDPA